MDCLLLFVSLVVLLCLRCLHVVFALWWLACYCCFGFIGCVLRVLLVTVFFYLLTLVIGLSVFEFCWFGVCIGFIGLVGVWFICLLFWIWRFNSVVRFDDLLWIVYYLLKWFTVINLYLVWFVFGLFVCLNCFVYAVLLVCDWLFILLVILLGLFVDLLLLFELLFKC